MTNQVTIMGSKQVLKGMINNSIKTTTISIINTIKGAINIHLKPNNLQYQVNNQILRPNLLKKVFKQKGLQ